MLLTYNLQADNIRTSLTRITNAGNGDVFVMSAVMISPASVTTITKLRLRARALQVVEPDWSIASHIPVAERTPGASTSTMYYVFCTL